MLSAETVFFTPRDKEREAKAARSRFTSADGDHATLLRVLAGYRSAPAKQRAGWCRDHFVNARALSRAADVADQLRRGCAAATSGQAAGASAPTSALTSAAADAAAATFGEDTAPLRRALTAGFFLQVARRQPDGSYRTLAGSQSVHLHPSSVMFGRVPPAECILYNELVRTSKLYVRDVSVIEPAWLAELAPRFYAARTAALPGGLGAAADT
jgi:ATP-dependent RNA helicase DHX8/PRP22